jgi:putative DNA primase/helicase
LTGEQIKPTAKPRVNPRESAQVSHAEYEQHQRGTARDLWSARRPIAGTIAETYLRERGYGGPLPPTLAFLPARDGHPPAMIAAFAFMDECVPGMLGEPDNIMAVHLTKLKSDGNKADTNPNKKVIASPAGLPIMVAPMNELGGLVVTEGIEDALSVHQATGLGAWAAGSAPFMPKLVAAVARAKPSCVTIFADDDKAGRDGARELASEICKFTEVLLREAKP